jgi:hypothetical protein
MKITRSSVMRYRFFEHPHSKLASQNSASFAHTAIVGGEGAGKRYAGGNTPDR